MKYSKFKCVQCTDDLKFNFKKKKNFIWNDKSGKKKVKTETWTTIHWYIQQNSFGPFQIKNQKKMPWWKIKNQTTATAKKNRIFYYALLDLQISHTHTHQTNTYNRKNKQTNNPTCTRQKKWNEMKWNE